jgi:two-component system, sensor histidine kinase and response regulator
MACFVLLCGGMTDRPRVLIVDDELGVRESLRAILGKDCDVLTASSGDEALALVEKQSVDLVTLDLRMPGMGGIAVLERIKKIDPEIEGLIITGYGSLDTAIQGLRANAFDYISKPFDCDQVRSVVQAALARRLATKRLRSAPEQILATLSHEFRTPLNVIMGYSTMLKDEGQPLSDEQQLALDRIQSNSTALLAYVETLFYMVELDRGIVPLKPEPIRVSEVLSRVADDVRGMAETKGLRLSVEASASLELTTDGDKLMRLVRALADNAVRYTLSGEVVLAAEPGPGGSVVIDVRDTGPGMAAELVAETRDVIAARPNVDPPRLLGFGLRLAGRLVRALGATLDVHAGPSGTRFSMAVPPSAPQADAAAASPRPAA